MYHREPRRNTGAPALEDAAVGSYLLVAATKAGTLYTALELVERDLEPGTTREVVEAALLKLAEVRSMLDHEGRTLC